MITWPIAIVIIGGITSICLTVLRIISMRKQDPNKEITKTLTETKERLIVIETKFDDHVKNEEGDFAEIKEQVSKLTDIIFEVLKKIKMNGH